MKIFIKFAVTLKSVYQIEVPQYRQIDSQRRAES